MQHPHPHPHTNEEWESPGSYARPAPHPQDLGERPFRSNVLMIDKTDLALHLGGQTVHGVGVDEIASLVLGAWSDA